MANFLLSGFADEAAVDLTGQIKALAANQMKYVELRHVDGINIGSLDLAKAKTAASQLQAAGIAVSALGSPLGKTNLADPFAPVLEMLRHLAQLAQIFATDKLRIFSFYLPEGQDHAACRQEVIERMGQLLDLADSSGVTLLHENERDIYGDTQAHCFDLHQALGSRLRGILDPANYLLVDSDPLSAMQQLADWIDYLHIKDVRLADRRIVPAGAGDGKIKEILALMAQKPGDHFLSVEPHLTLFTGRDQLEKETGVATPESDADHIYPDSLSAFTAAVQAIRQIMA